MGWDARSWDSGDVRVGLFGSTAWKDLSREQQVIGGLLGFCARSWGPEAGAGRDGAPNHRTWPAWTAAATDPSVGQLHEAPISASLVPCSAWKAG